MEEKDPKSVLNELALTQQQLDEVIAAKANRSMTNSIEVAVNEKEDEIENEANKYGQKAELAQHTIDEYNAALDEITDKYRIAVNALIAEKSELENQEFKTTAELLSEKSGKNDSKDVNSNNEKKEKLEELRNMQDSATKYIEDIASEHNETIENATQESGITTIQKQNFAQKWLSKITNKVNGKKKFEENVITPLEQKTDKIKEELPQADEKVEKSVKDKLKEMYNNGKERLGEIAASKKFKTLLNIAIQGSKPIIMASFGAKGAIISSVVTAFAGNLTQQNERTNTEELVQG